MHDIMQLYPPRQQQHVLRGLYLNLNLHRLAAPGDLLIYANYIASVDGRIAVRKSGDGDFVVPKTIANKRDWRLYQELAAQADVMLTSARYFRQLAQGGAQGSAQDLLPVGSEPEYADLAAWRLQQGMPAQPDVVILSNSLEIPAAALDKVQDRRITICTSERADHRQIDRLTSLGATVCMVGSDRVEGQLLRQQLIALNYRSAYMIAGPDVHRTLVADGALDQLFLTTRLNLLGHDDFRTIMSGQLEQPAHLHLQQLYLDQNSASPQLFAQYTLHPA